MLLFRRLLGFLALLAGLGWSARLDWGDSPSQSLLRLSWRSNGQEIKIPRVQPSGLPAHMRLPEGQAYDVKLRSYLLRVTIDGKSLLQKRIEPAGIHHDRPLSVFEELPVPAGLHRVQVEFIPESVDGVEPPVIGPALQVEREFVSGCVLLVTFQEEGQWKVQP